MSDQQAQAPPPRAPDPHCPTTTFSLPLRPRLQSTMADGVEADYPKTTPPTPLLSPGISVQFHGDPTEHIRPRSVTPPHPRSTMQQYPSPMRHHKRTPSFHREVKETLNARSEYLDDDVDGSSRQRINQYIIKDEIGTALTVPFVWPPISSARNMPSSSSPNPNSEDRPSPIFFAVVQGVLATNPSLKSRSCLRKRMPSFSFGRRSPS